MKQGFFSDKVRKTLGILISIILFTQQAMPVSIANAEGRAGIGEDVTSQVDFIGPVTLYSKDNEGNFTKEINENIKVNADSAVRVKYEFSIDNKREIKKGDYCILKVPKEIDLQGLGEIKINIDNTRDEFGRISVVDTEAGTVKLTFSTVLSSLNSNIKGSFYIDSSFQEYKYGDGGLKDLTFNCGKKDFYKKVNFNDVAREEPVITKTAGNYDAETKTIPWTITVDCKDSKELKDVKVEDILGDGQTFNPDTLELHENTEDGPEINRMRYNSIFGNDNKKFNLTFLGTVSGKKVIKIRSKVVDSSKFVDNKAINNVKLYADMHRKQVVKSSKADLLIPVGVISKIGEYYNPKTNKISWKVKFNMDSQTITAPVILKDTFDLSTQYFDMTKNSDMMLNGASIDVTDTDYVTYSEDRTSNKGTITISLGENDINLNTSNTLNYTTTATPESLNEFINSGEKGITFKNSIEYSDAAGVTGYDTATTEKITPSLIKKESKKYDYKNNLITWTVTLNKDEVPLNNAEFTDIIPNNQKYKEGSFSLLNKQGRIVNYDSKGLDINDNTINFKFSDAKLSLNKLYVIKYQTYVTSPEFFEGDKGEIKKTVSNEAKLKSSTFTGYKDNTVSSTGTCDVDISPIEKRGRYDADSDEIKWQVLINRNSVHMGNILISDTLNPELKLDKSSMHLYEIDASEGGLADYTNLSSDKEKTLPNIMKTGNTFSLNINDVEKPYVLVYSTKIRNPNSEIYNNGSVTNTADVTWKNLNDTQERRGSSTAIVKEIHHVSGGADAEGETGHLIVNKIDKSSKEPIKGAKFKIWTANGDENDPDDYAIATSDDSGKVEFKGLRYENDYYVKEVEVPEGYYINGDATPDNKDDDTDDLSTKKINIPNGQNEGKLELTWVNDRYKGNIKITKVDSESLTSKLNGAIFKVYKGEDITDRSYVGTLIYNEVDESYEMMDLPVGKYTVVEVKAPIGFELDSNEYPVTVIKDETVAVSNNSSKLFQNVPKKYNVKVTKVDSENPDNTRLSGAEFVVYPSLKEDLNSPDLTKGKTLEEVKEDGEGTGVYNLNISNRLRYGTYFLKEIKAPEGYILTSQPYSKFTIDDNTVKTIADNTIVVGNDNENKYFVNDKITGKISLTKVDRDNHELKLKGAEFKVYKDDGDNVFDSEKDIDKGKLIDLNNGSYEIENLPYGIYWVKETKAPAGYKIDTDKADSNDAYKVEIKRNGECVIVSNDDDNTFTDTLIRATLRIVKVDEDNEDSKLSGAVFKVYKDSNENGKYDNGEEVAGTFTEDFSGVYSIELPIGKYVVREEEAPEGYIKDIADYPVEIKSDSQIINITNDTENKYFKEKSIKGKMVLNKVDSDNLNKALPGAVFEVYKDSNNNGRYDSDDIFVGLANDAAKIGVYTLDNLTKGEYFVKETKAPIGYVIDGNVYSFDIVSNGDVKIISNSNNGKFVEEQARGKVELTMVDKEYPENKLTGGIFRVYKDVNGDGKYDAGDSYIGELTEDDLNKGVYYKVLAYGKYLLIEKQASEGFIKDENYYSFEITDTNREVNVQNDTVIKKFVNIAEKGDVEVIKVDEDYPENKLTGAEFAVYKDEDNDGQPDSGTSIDSLKETQKGSGIYSVELRTGKYLLKETKAPEGFLLDDKYHFFEINNNGETVKVETETGKNFIDKCIKGKVQLTKVDEDYPENKLTGAEFAVYEDCDNNGVPDSNTPVTLLNEEEKGVYSKVLRYGKYLLKEIKAPEGFLLDEKYYPFEINKNEQIVDISNDNFNKNFVDKAQVGEVYLTKVDERYPENKLTGARFDVYEDVNKNGLYDEDSDKYVTSLTESTKGLGIYSAKLRVGQYLLKEKNAPEGFVLDNEYYLFNINEDGQVVVVSNNNTDNFINKKVLNTLVIRVKEKYTEKPIISAHVKVYDNEGKLVYEGDTNEDGKLILKGLETGEYAYNIEKVPEGYNVYKGIKKVIVDKDIVEDVAVDKYIVKDSANLNKDNIPGKKSDIKNDVKIDITTSKDSESSSSNTENIDKTITNLKKVIKTGDNAKIGVLLIAALIALILMTSIELHKRRKKAQ